VIKPIKKKVQNIIDKYYTKKVQQQSEIPFPQVELLSYP
jgi:hypothetical protein